MNYGDIIKRAWRITWRFKALWVLGVFAGVSGCQGGGGGGGNGGGTQWNMPSDGMGRADYQGFLSAIERFLPALVVGGVFLVFVAILWSILSIAARAGLIAGASAFEDGRKPGLGELWGAGFRRWWAILGLGILLQLPVLAVVLFIGVAIGVPLVAALMNGAEPGSALIAPVCGSIGIGVPVLLVMSFVLGIMYLIALRYVVLGGQGVFESAGNAWRFLRARFKDTFLIWLINAGLNLAAGIAIAIPIVVIVFAGVFPMVAAGVAEQWGVLAGFVGMMIIVLGLVSLFYNAIWGTFTSSLWTVFFRDVTGMTLPAAVAPAPAPVAAQPYPTQPAQPFAPAPPVAEPMPPAPPVAEPMPPQPPAPPAADA